MLAQLAKPVRLFIAFKPQLQNFQKGLTRNGLDSLFLAITGIFA